MPTLAVLTNVPTPYRLALHARIDRELPAVRLVTLYTHDVADQAWKLDGLDPERNLRFGPGDAVDQSSRPGRALHEWHKGGRIIGHLRQHPPGALLLCGYNDPCRLRVLRWATSQGIPTFLVGDSNIHGESVRGIKALVKKRLVGWVVSRCAGVMPCGGYGAEFFAQYGATPTRTFYVPYEPDYALIENLDPAFIVAAAAKWGLDPARRRIVYCSRMIDLKRPGLALEAFVRIAQERPEFDLLMIGDGPLKAAVEGSIPEHLRGRVRFTGFIGSQPEISALYRSSHIFLHTSIYEPWGVVINESACAGMAIACTRTVGAAGELVRDGVNGALFNPDDLEGTVRALRTITDPARLPVFAAASRNVLADWRSRGDPVQGIRRALESCGVLKG
ncbi:MAG: glycosyltransferase family 4 protein [Phycisphaerales bacterium]